MKRTTLCFSLFVLLLALSLASCDSMFTTNIFAGITHPAQTTASIKAMSTTDLANYVASNANLQTLANDSSLKAAALDNLAATYASTSIASTADKQLAAETSATISIKTVPSATQFSGSLLGAITGAATNNTDLSTESNVLAVIKTALGTDALGGLSTTSAPSASFTAIISAFSAANVAYTALGNSVESNGYSNTSMTSSSKNEIAVDAVISALVSSVVATTPGTSSAQALWSALADPDHASSYLTMASLDTVKAQGSAVGALVGATSIGSLLGGTK